jgi:hypothetical protein
MCHLRFLQLLIVVLTKSSAEFGLTVAAIPVVLLLLIACGIAVKREIKWLMTGSLIVMLGAQAYFLYKFSRLFIGKTRSQYVSTRATLATVCEWNLRMVVNWTDFWIQQSSRSSWSLRHLRLACVALPTLTRA